MNFELTEEQLMIQEVVRNFVDTEVIPVASDLDKTHEFPWEFIKKMGEIGIMGIPVPTQYGGAGSDIVTYSMVIEELARAWASLALIVAVHTSVGTLPILQFGTDEQKERFLPKLATGESIGGFALTEPDAGSDAGAIKTVAVRDGDHYVLNGSKVFITNGSVATHPIIIAYTDVAKGTRGMSAFIVEKGTPGFTYGTKEEKLGMHASDTSELIFQDCRVPVANLLGKEGMGLKIALVALDGGRIGIGSQAVGIARGALEESIKYSKERHQFKRPIGKFQAVSFKIAEMATNIDAARLLVQRAAYLKDSGVKRFSKEASMAKVFASEVAMDVTTKAIQVFGGYGYTTDYVVERFFRDAKVTEIYEGTSEIQRLVIARSLLGM
jgi:alkylation response protein AidB-like acyl-CoA dehydrogenase